MNAIKVKLGFLAVGLMMSMSVTAHVNLKTPSGGETFNPGESVKIEWEVAIEHDTKNWDLYFSTDGGKNYEPLEEDINVNTLSFVWTVPSRASKEARIKIVQDNNGGDYSDESGNFTIAGTSTASQNSLDHSVVSLSPNPATNQVRICMEGVSSMIRDISVIDYSGRQIYSLHSVPQYRENGVSIDVSDWPAGVYFIIISTEQTVEKRKMVVR